MKPSRSGAISAALAVLASLSVACAKPPAPPPPEKVSVVKTRAVKAEARPVQLRYVGFTDSAATKAYAFKQGGRLTKVMVKKGDRVTPGMVLARQEPEDMSLAASASALDVRKAQTALADAKRTFARIEALVKDGVRPPNELDQARLGVQMRRASLNQARLQRTSRRRMVADTRLRSEVSGYVVDVRHHPGELVGGGHPVVIVRTAQQVIEVGVSQRDVQRLALGTTAAVTIDALRGTGTVSNIAQVPDRTSRTYEVQVALDEPLNGQRLLLGSLARVAFNVGEREGIWVPVPSVLTEGKSFVFVVQDGRASKRTVRLRDVAGPFVRVEGLKDGEQIIVEGMKTLSEGRRVEVKS